MAYKAHDVSLGNVGFLPVGKQVLALQQIGEKGSGVLDMGYGADVVLVEHIGGQVVKEDIRSLQSQAVGSMMVKDDFF